MKLSRRGPQQPLRSRPHPVRHRARGRRWRGGGAARAQRRRQVHHLSLHRRSGRAAHRPHRVRGQGCLGCSRPTRSCAAGSAMCRRSGASSRISTVEENLEVGRQPARPNAPHWTREKLFALFPNLGEMRGRQGGRMSGGEQQMLTIARTLMGNPSLVLLDEPSEGLSPKIVEQMVEAILTMKKEGVSIVVSEQNLHFAQTDLRPRLHHRARPDLLRRHHGRTRRPSGHSRRASGAVTIRQKNKRQGQGRT